MIGEKPRPEYRPGVRQVGEHRWAGVVQERVGYMKPPPFTEDSEDYEWKWQLGEWQDRDPLRTRWTENRAVKDAVKEVARLQERDYWRTQPTQVVVGQAIL